MRAPKSIQISIPHPCTQNWDEMKQATQGRHCAHCEKNVMDFTSSTDAALYRFFEKNPAHVCGRFNSTQVNRPINIPYQPQSRLYRMAVAMGLTLLFSQTSPLLAQNRPPLIEQNSLFRPSDGKPPVAKGLSGSLTGRVLNKEKEPVTEATVQVFQNGVLKGDCVTGEDGNYKISPLAWGIYEVVVKGWDYDNVRRQVKVARGIRKKDFTLVRRSTYLMGDPIF